MRLILAAAAVGLAALPLTAVAVRLPPAVGHPPVDGVESFDHGSRTGGAVALTFDADMTPAMLQELRSGVVSSWYNRAVRQVLDAEQVPATIFLTGLWTQTYPAVARSLADDPLFEIGNHTYDHAAFRTPCYGLAAAQDRVAEIARTQQVISTITGHTPRLLRFPGDCWQRSDAALARSLGLEVVSGDVPAGDGFNLSAVSIVSNVLGALRPGSIVMMHIHGGPDAPMTAPALRTIVQVVRQRGLRFATVSQLLQLGAATPPATPPATPLATPLPAPTTTAPTHAPAAPSRPLPVRRRPRAAPGLTPGLMAALGMVALARGARTAAGLSLLSSGWRRLVWPPPGWPLPGWALLSRPRLAWRRPRLRRPRLPGLPRPTWWRRPGSEETARPAERPTSGLSV